MMHPRWLTGLVLCLCGLALAADSPLHLGRFSAGDRADWQSKSFAGETAYELVTLQGRQLLRAVSDGTASGLFREQRVDLRQTPWLNWRWRVESTLEVEDETRKAGDDYPARIYVIVDGGIAFWRSKALNYVWSSQQPVGASWPNAFVGDKAMMLAVRSGSGDTGQLLSERRNVREDFQRLFGQTVDFIDAVALMTDTDNSGGQATAYYGDIWFSRD